MTADPRLPPRPLGQAELSLTDPAAPTRQLLQWAWRVAWSGKYLIFALWLLAIVPTILVLQQTDPLFTAEAKLMVEAPEASDLLSERANLGPWLSETVMVTQVEVAASTALAKRVVDRLNLTKDPEFNPALAPERPWREVLRWLNPLTWMLRIAAPSQPAADPDPEVQARRLTAEVVANLQSKLLVRMQRRSFIIQIQATSLQPAKAALLANTLAEVYVLDRLESSFENARRVSSWLGERLETLRRDVATAEQAVEEYRAANNLRRKGDRQLTVNEQQVSELNSRLILARTELAQKQARLDQVRSLLKSKSSIATTSDVVQSPLIQRLVDQDVTLQRAIGDASKTYGDKHPKIIGMLAEQTQLRDKIQDEVQRIAAAVANDVDIAVSGVRSLERDLEALRKQSNQASEAEVKLRELERQGEAAPASMKPF